MEATANLETATRPAIAAGLPGTGGWVLGVTFFMAAVTLPVLAFLTPPPVTSVPGMVPVALATLVYAATRLAVLVTSGRPRPLAGVLWLYTYVAMGVVPLAQVHTGLYPFLMDPGLLVPAQVLTLVCVVAFDAAYLANRRAARAGAAAVHRPVRGGAVVSEQRAALLTVLGLAASAYYVASAGGPATFFVSRSELTEGLDQAGLSSASSQVGAAFAVTLGTVPVLVSLIVVVNMLVRDPSSRGRTVNWVWLSALVIANVVVNNPVSNARYWFVTVVAGLVLSLPWFGRRSFRALLVAGILFAVVLFPYSDYFRNAPADRANDERQSSIAAEISTKDYDQSIMTANGLWWVEQVGYTDGRQLLGSVFFFVPRGEWPGKPLDTGVAIGRAMKAPNTNVSSPLWLEFYVDFGFLGAGLLAGALGYVSRWADDLFSAMVDARPAHLPSAQLLLALLAGYELILMRGPLLQAMSRLSIIIAVCLLLRVAADTRRIRPARPPAASRAGGVDPANLGAGAPASRASGAQSR